MCLLKTIRKPKMVQPKQVERCRAQCLLPWACRRSQGDLSCSVKIHRTNRKRRARAQSRLLPQLCVALRVSKGGPKSCFIQHSAALYNIHGFESGMPFDILWWCQEFKPGTKIWTLLNVEDYCWWELPLVRGLSQSIWSIPTSKHLPFGRHFECGALQLEVFPSRFWDEMQLRTEEELARRDSSPPSFMHLGYRKNKQERAFSTPH